MPQQYSQCGLVKIESWLIQLCQQAAQGAFFAPYSNARATWTVRFFYTIHLAEADCNN